MVVRRDPDTTRRLILDAAFTEIQRNGFRAASIDQILAETGLTKGALYHHFPNKAALGYAVVDELIRGWTQLRWIEPLQGGGNPIDALIQSVRDLPEEDIKHCCQTGCPLNNLAQEMSPIDETFRRKLQDVYRVWREKMAEALVRGQGAGQVRPDIDCSKAAAFVIASLEGGLGLAKNSQDPDVFHACLDGLVHYLESLRPQAAR